MKEAAAQAAAQARKAAEQAKDLAADVKDQASEKWAEDQQQRAAQDAPAPPLGTGSANSAPETGAPIAGSPERGPAPESSSTSFPPPPPPPTAVPGLRAKMADAAAGATAQARKSVEDAKDRGSNLKGHMREQAPTRSKSPDLLKNKKALVALAAVALVGIGGITIGAIAEGDNKDANTSSSASPSGSETPSSSTEPTPTPSSSATPTKDAEKPIVDTTVDGLLDKLNNEPIDGPGAGPKTGDRYRISGPLFESDAWGPTASGHYAVMFKAKDGADDLQVLVEESDASTWANGTKVEMVVELVEVTIDSEKLNGYLQAVSVKTLGQPAKPKPKADTEARMHKDLDAFADTFNTGFGDPPMITSIEPGSAPGVVYVNLNAGLLTVDVDVAQQAVTTMNEQLVESVSDNDAFSGMVKYFIEGELVGENKEILDPYSVSFKGGLED
ncbi:MAG: hypothetical protein JWM84_3714 [Nocardioides sp.]|nr:hypothetical protein [Nocardioides sp.]